jgi:uncharacterized protein YcnI
MRTRFLTLAAVLLGAVSPVTVAHVTVWPREAGSGAFEKYVVRVPTEGRVATASVELRIPDGVTIVSIGAPQGFRYELRKSGERTVAILWTQRIEPGEFAEFAFMARNPATEGSIAWNAVQTFVDGTRTEWSGPAGDAHPASVTAIKAVSPAPAGGATHRH